MTAQVNKRPAAIRVVLPFVFRHWLQQPVGAAMIAVGMLGATAADLFMPLRAALTGQVHGPELAPLLKLMPPEIVKRRLESHA